jgi:hypothetical protein
LALSDAKLAMLYLDNTASRSAGGIRRGSCNLDASYRRASYHRAVQRRPRMVRRTDRGVEEFRLVQILGLSACIRCRLRAGDTMPKRGYGLRCGLERT